MPEPEQTGSEERRAIRPLHGGRHSLPPDLVAFNQRERLLAAIVATVSEHGYSRATIARITEAAAVSRRTFYEHFGSKEECFLAAYDALNDYLGALMEKAAAEEEGWPSSVAAPLAALLRFLADRPDLARFYLFEVQAVGEGLISRLAERAARFEALLAEGRMQGGPARELAEGIEEALVGGILTLLSRRIAAGQAAELGRFIPAVLEFALGPYLGPDEARAVAAGYA